MTQVVNRPFVGVPSFLRAKVDADPAALKSAAIGVLGVPFDEGSPFLPGSRMGARAVREHTLRFPQEGLYDPETDETFLKRELEKGLIVDTGDVDIRPANAARSFELITQRTRAILDAGAFPVVLGGDHSITYPIFEAFDRPAHVLQFDAHQDYSEIDEDLNRTNSHAFRHITGMDTCLGLTQVGIRGLRTTERHVKDLRAKGHTVTPMNEARKLGAEGIAALLPAGAPVYVTIDVDALDMALIPGCVSGEPNGFGHAELMAALRAVAERCEIVGFDFVEVNPSLDVGTGATAYIGALVVCGFLGYICAQPWWEKRLQERGLLG